MATTSLEPKLLNQPPDKPAYRPFPELSRAIRAQCEHIVDEWYQRTLATVPDLSNLTAQEFKDDVTRILRTVADALESNDPPDLKRLIHAAPEHGFQRFMMNYDLADLFAEERVLRRVIIARVEEGLARQCHPDEAAALHSMIDIMIQQGVLALVQQQKQELRRATEVQLKYLSFLSHDLNNNFFIITSDLDYIGHQLSEVPNMEKTCEVLDAALSLIQRTREGMRGLLQHERLRHTGVKPVVSRVNLHELIEPIIILAKASARDKSLTISLDADLQAFASTNSDLLTIILQNLVGNAVKHASTLDNSQSASQVWVEVAKESDADANSPGWIISVIDNGPGIPNDQLDRLFNAFERLPKPGEKILDDDGFGLGLAIASEAARLLETKILVVSKVDNGSIFSFRVAASIA